METYKIEITSWTASFRYPNLISGFQPTLEVPPLSTVLGLINAASGGYQLHKNLNIGYFFQYEIKAVDLETIYMIEGSKGVATRYAKSNVINREFLFNNRLIIYITDEALANNFINPKYPLLLGRSNDLATVNSNKKIELIPNNSANKIKGQIIPFKGNFLQGQIQALPKYFTDTIPRNNLSTEPYSIISCFTNDFATNIKAYRDESILNSGVDIYFHELEFE